MTPEGSLLCPTDFLTATSYLRPNMILSSHLHLGLGGGFFPSGSMTKHYMHFVSLLYLLHSQLNIEALRLSEVLHKLHISSLRCFPCPHANVKENFKTKDDLAAISKSAFPPYQCRGSTPLQSVRYSSQFRYPFNKKVLLVDFLILQSSVPTHKYSPLQ